MSLLEHFQVAVRLLVQVGQPGSMASSGDYAQALKETYMKNEPQVGVGVIVLRNELVLLGKRRGSHGAGTWAPPGGHLEYAETIQSCARRETWEETGLHLRKINFAPYTNDVMLSDDKHYVTCFVQAIAEDEAEPRLMEPEKCEEWRWFSWSNMPKPLFQPLQTLVLTGFVPDHDKLAGCRGGA